MAISVVVLGTEPSVFLLCVFFVFLCAGGFTGACSYCFLFIFPPKYFEFLVPGFAFVWCFEFCIIFIRAVQFRSGLISRIQQL